MEVKGYLGLFCKAFSLNKGVVQLSVSIADLPLVHKQLKTLCHAWLVSMPGNTEDASQAHNAAHSLCCVTMHLSKSFAGKLIVLSSVVTGPASHSLCMSANPCKDPGGHMGLATLVPTSAVGLSHTRLAQAFLLSHRTKFARQTAHSLYACFHVQLDYTVCNHCTARWWCLWP